MKSVILMRAQRKLQEEKEAKEGSKYRTSIFYCNKCNIEAAYPSGSQKCVCGGLLTYISSSNA